MRDVHASWIGILLLLSACTHGSPAVQSSPSPSAAALARSGRIDPDVKDDAFTQTVVRFLEARVAGHGAETFLCCGAERYPLVYGREDYGRIESYTVEGRRSAEQNNGVTFTVSFQESYIGEPEDIVVDRVKLRDRDELKIRAVYFLGD